jgi:hypothetical protein
MLHLVTTTILEFIGSVQMGHSSSRPSSWLAVGAGPGALSICGDVRGLAGGWRCLGSGTGMPFIM